MDGQAFDTWLQSLTESRRSVLRGTLGILAGMAGFSTIEAKKKKKKCAKKCAEGCCTSKRGKCILPAQQNATQCGTGGEICHSTGCGGQSPPPLPEICSTTNCAGCCQGTSCEVSTKAHCGLGGVTCVACGANEDCEISGKCCGVARHTCTSDNDCCINVRCETDRNRCCVDAGFACTSDLDCCEPLERVCNGVCEIKNGFPCTLMQPCEGGQSCPASLICGDPGDCTVPCQESGQCSSTTCEGDLMCCTQSMIDFCNEFGSETFCGCLIEGGNGSGGCTRINLD